MDRGWMARGLEDLGLGSEGGLAERLWTLVEGLEEWSARLGLSKIRGLEAIAIRHVLDSLLLAGVVERPGTLIDVGTGPGLPALPLAALWPETRVFAVDSRRKSGWLVEKLARDMGLANVEHVCARAESPELLARLAGSADLVCARGLARPRRAVELCRPLVRAGGVIAILTGPEAECIALEPEERVEVRMLPGTDWERRILLCGGTPYPGPARHEGQPAQG